jgi:ABC-type glycerol-3-phosphate transport system substrate-binding protein
MTIASYWVEGASTKSTHQKEALLFMHYLSKKETAQKFYTETAKTRAFGEPYARTDLADTLKSNALVYPFVSQLKNATSSIFASDTNDGEGGINSLSNTYLGNAINSIVNDGSSAGSAVEILDGGIEQVLTKYATQ